MKLNLLLIAIIIAPLSYSQTQYLDQTFGQNGVVTTDINNNEEDPHNVYVQADGKIVVTGDLEVNGIQDYMVVRYNADGSLDNTFGNGGKVSIDFSPGEDDVARGLHFLPNGQILILGRRQDVGTTYEALMITRLNSDGSLDSTFGTNGYVQHNQPFDMNMSDLLPLANGKYISCGFTNDGGFADFIIVRFNADGTLDNAFGNNGYVVRNVLNSFDFIREMRELPNGDLIGVGWSNNSSTNADFPIMVRYKADGTPDLSFGNNGIIQVSIGGIDDTYRNLQLIGTTHFIASGKVQVAGQDQNLVVSKYNLSGEIDTSFGDNGHFIYDYASDDEQGDGLALQADGKIIAGFTTETSNGEDLGLLRLLPDGTLDSTYAQNGVFVFDVNNDDNVEDITVQDNGMVLIVGVTNEGSTQQDLLLLRVTGSITFGVKEVERTNFIRVYPNPTTDVLQIEALVLSEEQRECKLYAYNGQLLKTFVFQDHAAIDVRDIPAGNYILQVKLKGQTTTHKIRIQ